MSTATTGRGHHALIVNSVGVYNLDGDTITRGPVSSVSKFQTLLDWLRTKELLTPMTVTPQIWIAGFAACDTLGWNLDYADDAVLDALENTADAVEMAAVGKKMLTQRIIATLEAGFDNFGTGWQLRIAPDTALTDVATGPLIPLQYNDGGNRRFRVDVLIEPYMWTLSVKTQLGILGSEGGPSALPETEEELTIELARRIRWSIDKLGTLPAVTGAGTGANMVDAIFRPRRKAAERAGNPGRGKQKSPAFVTDATPLPSLVGDDLEAETPLLWSRRPTVGELEAATKAVVVDQRASYLASAGTINLGWGEPAHVAGAALDAALHRTKVPFGLWHVNIPAASEVNADPRLPVLLPPMQRDLDKRHDAWITTESLMTLTNPVPDGGGGIDLIDIDISEAFVYPNEGRILEAWAKRLRLARADAIETNDPAAREIVAGIYNGYIGRMRYAENWSSKYKQHHHQPVWRWAIIANARARARRHAMRIATEHALWPIAAHTDSWTYLTDDTVDLADHTGNLGRLRLEKQFVLTDAVRHSFENAPSITVGLVESILANNQAATSVR